MNDNINIVEAIFGILGIIVILMTLIQRVKGIFKTSNKNVVGPDS